MGFGALLGTTRFLKQLSYKFPNLMEVQTQRTALTYDMLLDAASHHRTASGNLLLLKLLLKERFKKGVRIIHWKEKMGRSENF